MAGPNSRFSLFGFTISKDVDQDTQPSFTAPTNDDGAITITGAAHYGVAVDLENTTKNDIELISRYREMAMQPELESAIDDIVNEAICQDDDGKIIQIVLDDLKQPTKIKEAIKEEFNTILKLLNYTDMAQDIFRRYYIDGRLYYHVIVDKENPTAGVLELRYIDPRKLKKVREVKKQKDERTGAEVVNTVNEYYTFNDKVSAGSASAYGPVGTRITTDSIVSIVSGLMDARRATVLSFLHKCITGDGRIKTPSGWTAMRDIEVGDSVYALNTKTKEIEETKVTNKWNNGYKDIVVVRSKHTQFKCTTDHPIYVYDKKIGDYSYVEAGNLIPKRHQITIPKTTESFDDIKFPETVRETKLSVENPELWCDVEIKGKKKIIHKIADDLGQPRAKIYSFVYGYQSLSVNLAESVISMLPIKLTLKSKLEGYCLNKLSLPEYVDEDFAKLFGFLIGDGWVNKYTVGFAEGDKPHLNEIYHALMVKYFGNCSLVVGKTRVSKYNSYYSNNTLGAELMKQMGFITGATKKRIPEWVFKAKNSIKIAFIQGLMDADGSKRDNLFSGRWSYTTNLANENLIKDIKEIWTSVGYSSGKIYTVKQRPTTIFGKEVKHFSGAWSITLTKTPLELTESVFDVTAVDGEEVFDIEVEHEDHNFIVNGAVVHNCIRPLNQLRMIEDATVIYRISRAPERRIFYIDVGNLPKLKAEQYLRDIMVKYKNKLVYDANTGEIRDDRKFLSMMEDFWLPRREGGKGTEITTLPGGQNLGELKDLEFFEKKLYKSLNVPISRLDPQSSGFSLGRSGEITRDELKFSKFVGRMRAKFSDLFDQCLRVQCVLKGICTDAEWKDFKEHIHYSFIKDNNFTELKEAELMKERLSLLQEVDPYTGRYFSQAWIQRNVLRLTDDEIEKMESEIEEEKEAGMGLPVSVMNDVSQQQMMANIGQEDSEHAAELDRETQAHAAKLQAKVIKKQVKKEEIEPTLNIVKRVLND